jgi:predicted O-linked N-acetylglucosamine transferase (SPINDLY family)
MSGSPFDPAMLLRQAFEMQQLGRTEEAARVCREILSRAPDHPRALQLLGVLDAQRGENQSALALFERAASVEPHNPVAHYNHGNLLSHLGRLEQSLTAYERALQLAPDYVDAWNNHGSVLERLKRLPEALESYDRSLRIDPHNVTALYNKGYALTRMNRLEDALVAYSGVLGMAPGHGAALNNRGGVFMRMHRPREALADFDRLVALQPGDAVAHSNRGDGLLALARYEEALRSYRAAIAIRGDLAAAHRGCGEALAELHRYDEAFQAYDTAFRLAPNLPYLEGSRLHAKMHVCDWSDLEAEESRLITRVEEGELVAEPFVLLVTPASSTVQLRCAQMFVADRYPPIIPRRRAAGSRATDKIRLGYVSGEFRDQATAYLTAELFECHDRARFEIHAFATGHDDRSIMRKRLATAFLSFNVVGQKSDLEIARLIEEAGIDVLVNLNGYFGLERTGVFAHRPCAIQVNYLGFPGTMGAPYMDYIVVDRIVLPETARGDYSENVVYLPHCYQPNDRKRPTGSHTVTRAECGLPDTALVFACFNNNHKLNPQVFDVWMRLLRQVPDSVLWLLQANASVERNLTREAEVRGVSPARLVFAPMVNLEHHMSRLRLADLFLDTLPHNAHTTASDALWCGVPVLTCIGETFAGRVAASLLTAVELPELITSSPEAYEAAALGLAHDREALAAIKRKLAENRLSVPLFDTRRYTRDLESVYITMVRRQEQGLPPASFGVGSSDDC